MRRLFYIPYFTALILILNIEKMSAQNRIVDSLKLALGHTNVDTVRLALLVQLSEQCNEQDILKFANPAVKLAESILEKNQTLWTINEIRHIKQLESLALNNVGFAANQQGNTPMALECWKKSLNIQEKINDKEGIANSLNNIGAVYQNLGDISMALNYYLMSLKIREEMRDKHGIANSLNNIGVLYKNQGDLTGALDYFQKSLKIRNEINDKMGISTCLNNIGNIYSFKGNTSGALNYFEKSLLIKEEIKDNMGIANALNDIGGAYARLGNMSKALDYINKSLKIEEEINDRSGIAYSLSYISSIYFKQGTISKALPYALRSMAIAKEIGYPESIRDAAGTLKVIYLKLGESSKALEMYELFTTMHDSINNEVLRKMSIQKQFQYRYEKKAEADSLRSNEERKVNEARFMQERTQRLILCGGLFFVAVFGAVIFKRFKVTQKQKYIIEKQKNMVTEKQKEILDSIHYAKRIQTALMANENYIEKNLNRLNSNMFF